MMALKLVDALAAPDDVRFVYAHLRAADRAEVLATRFEGPDDDLATRTLASIAHFPTPWGSPCAWVAYGRHRPVALVGAVQSWPGVWSCFMVGTDEFRQIGFQLTRFVRGDMIPRLNRAGAIRAEARSMATHHEAHRWLRALGATPEATLKRYGKGGEDFIIFRWDRFDV